MNKSRHRVTNTPTTMLPTVGGRAPLRPNLHTTAQKVWAAQAATPVRRRTGHGRILATLFILAILAAVLLTAAGCSTTSVEGTVVNKTQRMESVCTEYKRYRSGRRSQTKCARWADEMHNYLVILPDGTKWGGDTKEVKVSLELFEQTAIGSHYPAASN